MFKKEWEKTRILPFITPEVIQQVMEQAYIGCKTRAYEILSGGCSNINIKVFLSDSKTPRLLRIYVRDKRACVHEAQMGRLLASYLPVPKTDYYVQVEGFVFAVTSFLEGTPLRDVLVSGISDKELLQIMTDVGRLLGKISNHEFQKGDLVGAELVKDHEEASLDAIQIAQNYGKNETIRSYLGEQMTQEISSALEKYAVFFPKNFERNLVHGDFDPANILVQKMSTVWRITGILDWEFSFLGSTLWDMANMLRYSYKMPPLFEESFIQGARQGKVFLPKGWPISIRLLNILGVLDCLNRSDPQKHPRRWADCKEILGQILLDLSPGVLRRTLSDDEEA